METIIFIETSKRGSSREAVKAAARLGFITVLFTEKKRFLKRRKEFPDIKQMIHFDKMTEDLIRTEISQLQIQGRIINAIISFVDPFVSLAAQLSNELCKSNISVEALRNMEDKTATRRALKENPTTPKFEVLQPMANITDFINKEHSFPLIVKSPLSNASKDVYLVENKYELKKAIKKFLKIYPDQQILLEEYLDGPQYLVEVLVHNGKINIVAIFEQEITKEIKFIVTGYAIRLNVKDDFYNKLYNTVESIINDLKVTNAACHFEIRYVNGNWKLVEINPRISAGAMNRMIEEAFGINLVEETIRLYLGDEPNLIRKHEKHIYTHYITMNSRGRLVKVTGKNRAANEPGVREVNVKLRKRAIMPPRSMGHRYGYVIATGNTLDEAKANAVNAGSKIKFHLEPFSG
ncbi:argininosuccinate lyase [Siminovitchia terrae]|uniref:Argininosuccinate lyase n=1 Tax=Siminovitchia terrae TaxID=1914933 RepID=A0ABQ4KQH4_SIMTE|nr:ATP-grasp domain-containing protein [Siminovitchia terrae]GIN94288.1 argininosuccinate lyase [Siminovitchia terrae]